MPFVVNATVVDHTGKSVQDLDRDWWIVLPALTQNVVDDVHAVGAQCGRNLVAGCSLSVVFPDFFVNVIHGYSSSLWGAGGLTSGSFPTFPAMSRGSGA